MFAKLSEISSDRYYREATLYIVIGVILISLSVKQYNNTKQLRQGGINIGKQVGCVLHHGRKITLAWLDIPLLN